MKKRYEAPSCEVHGVEPSLMSGFSNGLGATQSVTWETDGTATEFTSRRHGNIWDNEEDDF